MNWLCRLGFHGWPRLISGGRFIGRRVRCPRCCDFIAELKAAIADSRPTTQAKGEK